MKHETGFTLTELLIAITISGVVMAAVYSAYLTQRRSYQRTEEITTVQQNLRAAMYYMAREIRMAGYDPMESDLFGFTGATSNLISFTMDEDENGVLSGATETVSYQYDASENTLERNEGGGFRDIAENISGVTFVYYDQNGNETTIADEIRSVDITLSASQGDHSRELITQILCRNMGL